MQSIFERKKPLVENTMRRIAKGLKKFVFDAAEPFIVTCNHAGDGFRGQGLNEPLKTVTSARDAHGLVTPFMSRQFGNNIGTDCEEPAGTVTAGGGGKTVIVAPFLTEHANSSTQRVFDADEPLRTQCAQIKGGHFALVNVFIVKHFGGFFDGAGSDVKEPFPTILTRNTQNQLCTSNIMKMRGQNIGHPAEEPFHTVSAGGTHHAEVRAFLIKYFGTDQDTRMDQPVHTVTTKHRFGLVTIMGELYRIIDIGMRMLVPRELYRAQSFPDSYIISHTATGKKLTQSAQVKMCGNSVPPIMVKVLVKANANAGVFIPNSNLQAAT